MKLFLHIFEVIESKFYNICSSIRGEWWNFIYRCQRFRKGYSWLDVHTFNDWFIETIRNMLEELLDEHYGHPSFMTDEEYSRKLREMIGCLYLMDEEDAAKECGVDWETLTPEQLKQISETRNEYKKKFFKLFEELFWDLWD